MQIKGCEKSSVAVQIDARIQSSNFYLMFCWPIARSHARLFVEIYIRACDKLTFFSKYAVHTGVQVATPLDTLFLFYKNHFYKNVEAEICPQI